MVTRQQIEFLWPQWPRMYFSQFQVAVLGRQQDWRDMSPDDEFSTVEFVTIAIDRWLCKQARIQDVARQHALEQLTASGALDSLCEKLTEANDDDGVEGFFISIFNGHWFTWTGTDEITDLKSFNTAQSSVIVPTAVWQIVLNVTGLYFGLCNSLEAMPNAQPVDTATQ